VDLEERLAKLENQVSGDERFSRIERTSIRFTAFVLLELALLALVVWSVAHLCHFLRLLV